MIEVCGRACHGDVEVTNRLLGENNRLGEENFKLRDAATQLGQQLETERGKGKEAEANFAKAMEELGKAEENVRIFEENISEAYDNGFDEASRQFEDQVQGVIRKIRAKCWAHCLGQVGVAYNSPLWAQDQVPEGLDLTITETEISDDEAGPPAPVVLPLTSVIRGQQEAGSSSAAIVAANLPGPTNIPASTDSVAHANPAAPLNPAAPVIDVDQKMIAPAA